MMSAHFSQYLACLALAFAMMTNACLAAPYFKPDEAKEIFKVEKVPLQVDSMKELAKHLVIVARREQKSSPANQRANSQLLALAMRLDPANQDAREVNKSYSKGSAVELAQDSSLKAAKSRLRFFTRWLASPEAGGEANRLAHFLTDATKTLNPDTKNKPDIGNWAGVVPSLEKFAGHGNKNRPKPPKSDRNEDPGEEVENDNENTAPIPDNQPRSTSDFHLKNLSVLSPFALQTSEKYRDPKKPGKEQWRTTRSQGISKVELTLSPGSPGEKNQLTITSLADKSKANSPIYKGISKTLVKLLANRHSGLPRYKSAVTISGGNYSNSNKLALTAPLALMLESSLTNAPLREDIHVCATVDEEGKLSQPENFWQMLTTLRKAERGGRLIVSTASAKLMIQVLVYGEADFFTRWEVYSADTLDEALAVATKRSASDLSEAGQLFDSIQNLARKTDATKLAVNRAVRSRLAKIVGLAPNHVSSSILLLQGSGKRPMRLSEEALAHELLPIVKMMNHTLMDELRVDNLSSSSLKKTHDSSRKVIDSLERILDRSNDDLYQDVLREANEFRRLMTINRRINGENSNETERKKARGLFYAMQRKSEELLSRTLLAAGLPDPEKRPNGK